jgi:TPR repeat protein
MKQDKKVAKEWFRKACDNKVQKSCRIYKMLNEQGY